MSDQKPTEAQLDLLRHMLGINDPSRRDPESYRNYAAVSPGDEAWKEMEALGWVEQYKAQVEAYLWYRATPEGKRLAIKSFYNRRMPASRRRYLKFLSLSDVFPNLTFKEFLTSADFADARAAA